jgi:TPP-dependent pyruvate/acetoin dehydrogenase alpha subunit
MPGINVDGMDVFAVYAAVEEARQRALAGEGPSLVNLRCYRQGGHSSSDDPTRYRNEKEVEYWAKRDPLARIENYLYKHDLLSNGDLEKLSEEITAQINTSVKRAEATGEPPLESLVEDVFATPPQHLRRQVAEALRIVAEKGDVEKLLGKFPL